MPAWAPALPDLLDRGRERRRVLGDAAARRRGWPPGRRRPWAAPRGPPVSPQTGGVGFLFNRSFRLRYHAQRAQHRMKYADFSRTPR